REGGPDNLTALGERTRELPHHVGDRLRRGWLRGRDLLPVGEQFPGVQVDRRALDRGPANVDPQCLHRQCPSLARYLRPASGFPLSLPGDCWPPITSTLNVTIIDVAQEERGPVMDLLKVAAVVVGGIVVFIALDFVVHALFALLTTLVIVAIIAGGGYVAYKVVGGGRRREIKRGRY